MDFETLGIVLELANGRNISDVARVLFLSQSTVSRKLTILENELDVELFVRSKGHSTTTLTATGERFIQIAKKILELNEEALHLKDYHQRTRLNVTLVDSIVCVLSPFFQQMSQEMADLVLSISNYQSWDIHDLIRSRTADVGICNYAPIHSDLLSELLFEEEYVVVRKGTAPIDRTQSVHPSELPAENGIYYSFQAEFNRWHDYWWSPGQSKLLLQTTHFLVQLFTSTEDWSILPLSLANSLPTDEFYITMLSVSIPKRSCYLILHKNVLPHLRQPIKDFCMRLKSYLKTGQMALNEYQGPPNG